MRAKDYLNPWMAKAIAHIATDSGHAIMEVYERPEAWNVEFKGDASPLTQADLKANEIIVDGLTALAGEIPVLSEESPWTGGDATTYWAVDPLDGTKEFLKRNGEFTVNIALVIEGIARMGVICAPALKMVWAGVIQDSTSEMDGPWAARAQLSALQPEALEACSWERILVAKRDVPPLRIVGSRSHGIVQYPDWVSCHTMNTTPLERGSSLKFCLIAQGDADLYVRMGPTSIWDTAAGHAILSAAGGEVVHAETGDPLNYSVPSQALNPNFVAYGSSRFGPR
jgi:3'(2'), 5'-bisphosphate nucleotidase